MATFTAAALFEKTNAELRAIAENLGFTGLSKKTKNALVALILEKSASTTTTTATVSNNAKTPAATESIKGLSFNADSILTNPSAPTGRKTTTTIRVSCGANASSFPVVGKTVGQVADFLREILNVDRMAQGVVNGKAVEDTYVLKEGDSLEFIKPAGKKG